MGILRFVLAMTVVYSHVFETGEFSYSLFGHQFQFFSGALAVVLFYMISGYYMQKKLELARKNRSHGRAAAIFYLDRAWRIYPTYFICFFMSLSYMIIVQKMSWRDFPTSFLLLNFLVIPTGFYFLTNSVFFRDRLVIPVTPSLALEEMFFAIYPLLDRWAIWLCFFSLGIFMGGMTDLINMHTLSYASLPGSLFLFLTGSMLSELKRINLFVGIALIACLLGFSYVALHPSLQNSHRLEMSLAYVLGVLALLLHMKTSTFRFSPKLQSISNFLGTLSYPVFLLHWMAIDYARQKGNLTWAFVGCLVLALPVNIVERKIQMARRQFIGLADDTFRETGENHAKIDGPAY